MPHWKQFIGAVEEYMNGKDSTPAKPAEIPDNDEYTIQSDNDPRYSLAVQFLGCVNIKSVV